ncbi:aminotransferase class I/II-fold pyridoxal phosphate-dependent enzyme [Desulfovibrio sp. OttesenSCG-928-F20]|nr:aminotransferase class I/II-fold pyridoxal phosphate-dependent enzyme [Desulfovibrio sp. OttesenSCG-928-F20]
MNDKKKSVFGLDREGLSKLKSLIPSEQPLQEAEEKSDAPQEYLYDKSVTSFSELPAYKQLQIFNAVSEKMGIFNPFYTCHQSIAKQRTLINGEEYLNYSTYDYLGLNGHPKVNAAATAAIEAFGTSSGASRLLAGERPGHKILEDNLADFYQTEAALIFVSGHATNVSTLATLLTPADVVYHDALAHDSILQGALLSGAQRYSYPHNDNAALESLLEKSRSKHRRALIVTEGLFSMDGSIADLPGLIELKKRFGAFLMVDEAHSLGVVGETGRGAREYFGLAPDDVDIWMGTMSKTLCGCGGFIAGNSVLIELLRFKAPGFVYSVGMSPALAAASNAALNLVREEPDRVHRLQRLSALFLKEAKARGLNTGYAMGYGIIPIIVGSSMVACMLCERLLAHKINVMPIMYPAVEEGTARLRFFLSAVYEEEPIAQVLDILVEELAKARAAADAAREGGA